MTLPTVTEISLPLEPVAHDPFIDDADDGSRAGTPTTMRSRCKGGRGERLLTARRDGMSTLRRAHRDERLVGG